MKRAAMVDLLALLNPTTAKILVTAGVSDEQLEFALFHEAFLIAAKRECDVEAELKEVIDAALDAADETYHT